MAARLDAPVRAVFSCPYVMLFGFRGAPAFEVVSLTPFASGAGVAPALDTNRPIVPNNRSDMTTAERTKARAAQARRILFTEAPPQFAPEAPKWDRTPRPEAA